MNTREGIDKVFRGRVIDREATLIQALRKMDDLDKKLLAVVSDHSEFCGLVSVGDIQRAIIDDIPLSAPVNEVTRENIRVASPSYSDTEIRRLMLDFRMEFCPVVAEDKAVYSVFFWEDCFGSDEIEPKTKFDLPVVIMAGGLGKRLRPLTSVIPKPLIPIKNKTMLEHIFDRFNAYNCSCFYLSVNYKSDLIDYYISQLQLPYTIHYFEEEEPQGTAGSLSLLKGKISSTFFVTNCDILIEQDYSEILNYHNENSNELTVVAALKDYPIPYGTIETGKDGKLVSLSEKPDLTLKINSGMYILEPHLLEEIPPNAFFHITDLIKVIKERSGNVGVFPVSESSWKDIGDWDEYLKNMGGE